MLSGEIFQNKSKLIDRRMFILSFVKIGVFVALVSRLFYLQISENIKYRSLSDKNRLREWKLAPQRGILKDYFGENLAEKFGLPCWLRVTELDGETNAEVLVKPNSIEIHVTGDPKPAIKAAKRKITSIVVAPSLSGSLESFKALTDLPVAVA